MVGSVFSGIFVSVLFPTYMCMQYNKRKRFGNFCFCFSSSISFFSLCAFLTVFPSICVFTHILTPLWSILPGYRSLPCIFSIFLNYQSRKKHWYFSLNYQFEFYKLGWLFFPMSQCSSWHFLPDFSPDINVSKTSLQLYSIFNWSLTILFYLCVCIELYFT